MINGKLKMKSPERDPSFPLSSFKETYGIKYTSKLEDEEGGKVIGGTRGWDPNCVLIKKNLTMQTKGVMNSQQYFSTGNTWYPSMSSMLR